jgi:metal-responsive CopG/Arc/MetJ family transcriptional regulator
MRNNKNVRADSEEVKDLLDNNISDNENINESENTFNNVTAYIIANKKPKFEELHKKDTFWVKNEVLEKLHEITKGNKGMKTQIINEALELFFKVNKI